MVEVAALMEGWLTPTSLFLLLNFVIATIFFTSALGFGSKANQINKPQQPESTTTAGPHPQLFRAPSLFSRVTSFNFSSTQQQHQYSHTPEPHETHFQAQPQPQPDPLSLLARVASFCRTQDPAKEELAGGEGEKKEKVVVVKQRKVAGKKTAPAEKTAALRCSEEEVDAKADDFINRFKQQLKLQRLESLLRYRNPAS